MKLDERSVWCAAGRSVICPVDRPDRREARGSEGATSPQRRAFQTQTAQPGLCFSPNEATTHFPRGRRQKSLPSGRNGAYFVNPATFWHVVTVMSPTGRSSYQRAEATETRGRRNRHEEAGMLQINVQLPQYEPCRYPKATAQLLPIQKSSFIRTRIYCDALNYSYSSDWLHVNLNERVSTLDFIQGRCSSDRVKGSEYIFYLRARL